MEKTRSKEIAKQGSQFSVPNLDSAGVEYYDEGLVKDVLMDPSDDELKHDEILADNLLHEELEYPDLSEIDADDAISLYFREAASAKLLTRDEEIQLAGQIQSAIEATFLPQTTETSELILQGRIASHRMTISNTRLVINMAKRYKNNGVPFLDLIQEGNIGLMRAVQKFDHTRGNKFSTYATWWIREGILRSLGPQREGIYLPVHVADKARVLFARRREYMIEHGHYPDLSQLADMMSLTVEKVDFLMKVSRLAISLQMLIGQDKESEFGDFLEDKDRQEDVEETSMQTILRSGVEELLLSLPTRHARVLELLYGLSGFNRLNMREIGDRFGISRERVRQLRDEAFSKVRSHQGRVNKFDGYA